MTPKTFQMIEVFISALVYFPNVSIEIISHLIHCCDMRFKNSYIVTFEVKNEQYQSIKPSQLKTKYLHNIYTTSAQRSWRRSNIV